MPARTVRAFSATIALVALALALPGSAAAISPVTVVTAPTNGSLLLAEEGGMVKIKGTALKGITKVALRCYYWSNRYTPVEEVAVTGGAFETEVPTTALNSNVCTLRAIPTGEEPTELGPGAESAAALEYQGPMLAVSFWTFEPGEHNFFAAATTLSAQLSIESVGTYAFESQLYSPLAHAVEFGFYGDLSLPPAPEIGTRAGLQVNGVNAYLPADVRELEKLPTKPKITGDGQPAVTRTFNEATRQFTIHEEDPVYYCAPNAATFPPTSTSCTSFVSAGVTVVREWQTTNESRLGLVTERWRSTDGAAHSVNARYFNELHSGNESGFKEPGGVFMFPGQTSFAPTTVEGETRLLPAGPGTILYKTSPTVSEGGDGIHPQLAWAYDRSPAEAIRIDRPSTDSEFNSLELPYQFSVPAGGSSAPLRMAFAQSFNLAEARALAEGALASFHPSVAITSPANGASIVALSPTITVSGIATDGIGVSSLTVDGKAVAVGAGGVWSTPVTLNPGANTITATATDSSGLTGTAAVTVDYAVPPAAIARLSGKASGKNGKITLTLICSGLAGQSCKIAVNASTLEHLLHGRLRSISARNKRVGVAATTLTLAAGQRITISLGLNKTGRKLLQRFGRLPVTLKATLVPASGKPTTLLNTSITVKPKPKPKPKHHH